MTRRSRIAPADSRVNIRSIMVIAGEPSGDLLAAELVAALRAESGPAGAALPPDCFFGAGGPQLAAAGVKLAFDMTQHAVVGLVEVIRNYRKFKQLFDQLVALALQKKPDVIVCVDFSGFNRRFARQIRWEISVGSIPDWRPRIVQYVSPQVWASRPGRARAMARDVDLLLTIFPFEKQWYGERLPKLQVEFVGHPMLDRYARIIREPKDEPARLGAGDSALVLLLPGSRVAELNRHLPVMLDAWKEIHAAQPATRTCVVLPNEPLAALAKTLLANAGLPDLPVQVGQLDAALRTATLAIASTGTVTMECAFFSVPTVALYKTSWGTYQIGKRIIQVKYLAMPNLLADRVLFPEFIQNEATASNIARAALELLQDGERRQAVRKGLSSVIAALGGPGASTRAARAILKLS